MKTYLVNIPSDEYLYAGEIEALNWDAAQAICDRDGYLLLGEFVGSVDCPDVVEAMFERQYGRVH